MSNATLTINGVPESLGRVWVHIQPVRLAPVAEYRFWIPKGLMDFVFDGTDKPEHASWNDHLTREAHELGSAIISIYFKQMSNVLGIKHEKCRWVIATLDAAVEDHEGIELQGRAVPFDPDRFAQ